ncbi:hypothetical protein [Helicobacter sp. 11S03491-1]|uniref:hypothetical protein n=1 Tax=Helicobacter sp. 11S03491-1 TaxID=1476196 RepID=UPI000BA76C65|nr:hypothetical protein [Helicobacter sp. 11S03491-1]PAF43843.1 hypothetical protein BKH45_00845 [Helicobacter sp. 11S03491-1]
MSCKYSCFLVFLFINIISAILCVIFWEIIGLLNFEVGFFSFFLVLYSTYVSLKRKIKKELAQASAQAQDPEEKKPKTKFNFSNLILGLELSMGFFRIFAYIILIGTLILLINKNIFMIIPYIIGIGVCLSSVTGLKYLSEAANNTQNQNKTKIPSK